MNIPDKDSKPQERHCFDNRVKFPTAVVSNEGKVNKQVYVSTYLALKGNSKAQQNSIGFY